MEDDQHQHQQRVVGEQVADEELRLLEAMAAVFRGMQQVHLIDCVAVHARVCIGVLTRRHNMRLQMNGVLGTLTRQTVELSQELATAERQMVRASTRIAYISHPYTALTPVCVERALLAVPSSDLRDAEQQQ